MREGEGQGAQRDRERPVEVLFPEERRCLAAVVGARRQQPERQLRAREHRDEDDDGPPRHARRQPEIPGRRPLFLEQRDERQGQCRERDELDGDEDRHHRLRRWRVGVEEPSGDGGDQRRHQQRQRRRDGVPGLPGRQMAGESIGGVHDLISTSKSTAPPDNGTWPSSRAPGVSPPPSPACARRPCPTRRRARRAGRRPCRARKCGPRATSPGSRRSTPRTPRSGRPRTPRRGPWSR